MYYWLGEVLSICDEFIDLQDIQYALQNNIYETVLFKFLEKPRKYNVEYKYKIVITKNNYYLKFNGTYKNYLRLSK